MSKDAPLSNAERQRRWRQRHRKQIQQWRATLPKLRVTATDPLSLPSNTNGPDPLSLPSNTVPLRIVQATAVTEDSVDDVLTALSSRGNRLLADYVSLLTKPGLTDAHVRTVRDRYLKWRHSFETSAANTPRRHAGQKVFAQLAAAMKETRR